MKRKPLNDQEEREMYCRLAYLIPVGCLGGIYFAAVLGAVFRGTIPNPGYSEQGVALFAGLFSTVSSVACIAFARPPWWHAILWPATIFVLWSFVVPFLAYA